MFARRRHRFRNCSWTACAVGAVLFFGIETGSAIAGLQPQAESFAVPVRDRPAARALARELAALSPVVSGDEAKRLADCAYATAGELKHRYGVMWPPLFNNFLIHTGIKKRGLCFQLSEDLMVRFDALQLRTLELHWGEARAGTWKENNGVVVTAKNQPFNRGIVFDCWRNSGRLFWSKVTADYEPWVENKAYARFIRTKSAVTADRRGGGASRSEDAVNQRPGSSATMARTN